MKQLTQAHLNILAQHHGVVYDTKPMLAQDAAQPGLTTNPNGGTLAQFLNYIDPEVVNVIFTPMKAAELGREEKKGDWTSATAQFPISESVGYVKGYGDYDNGGEATANFNWEPRQSFQFQTTTTAGEREIAIAGAGRIDYLRELTKASYLVLNKFQNASYLFGIDGLANYGILNDPGLNPSITPTIKASGGTGWESATSEEIYNDFQKMFLQLVTQLGGNVDRDSPLTYACSPQRSVYLRKANAVMGVTAEDMIRKGFPNMKFVSVPEYSTASGEVSQMIARSIDTIETCICGFTEKMRAHQVVQSLSSFSQKKSGGTWGMIIRRPAAIVTMIGI